MQGRLLNAYLSGAVEEDVYRAKASELTAEPARADETLAQMGGADPTLGESATALFDWTQNAAETWRRSNNSLRREILDAVCLNRTPSDATLVSTKRKPFDVLAEGRDLKDSRGDKTAIELFSAGVRTMPTALASAVKALAAIVGGHLYGKSIADVEK